MHHILLASLWLQPGLELKLLLLLHDSWCCAIAAAAVHVIIPAF
jgi:hypothetical protein